MDYLQLRDRGLAHSTSVADGELTGGPGNLGPLGPRFALARLLCSDPRLAFAQAIFGYGGSVGNFSAGV